MFCLGSNSTGSNMGSCCKPASSPPLPPASAAKLQLPAPPMLYFISSPYLFTYNPQHHIAWKEELSVDGKVDQHYKACLLTETEMMVVSKGQTFIVYAKICSAVRKAPVSEKEVWRGDLIAYKGEALAANACVKKYDAGKDVWKECVDLWATLAEYFGACLSSGCLYLIGSSADPSLAVQLHPFELPSLTPRPPIQSHLTVARSLLCYPLSSTEVLLISDYEETVFDSALLRFSKTVDSHLIDRSPGVTQVYAENVVYVIKESGSLLESRLGVRMETRIPEKDEQLANKDSLLERCPAATLLERDESIRHRPGLYTYAANFEEETYFCMQFNTLSMVVREIPAADEPIIPRNAGWCVLPNGDLLLAGGFDSQGDATSEVMIWNTITAMRSSTTPLPVPQAYVRMTVAGKDVFALGAVTSQTYKGPHVIPSASYFQRYDLETNSWIPLPKPLCPLLEPGLCEWRGTVYTFGGCAAEEKRLAYDLVTGFEVGKGEWRRLEVKYPEEVALVVTISLSASVLCFSGLRLPAHQPTTATYVFTGDKFIQRSDTSFQTDKAAPMLGFDSNNHLVCIVETSGTWSVYDHAADKWRREEELRITADD